MMTQVPGGHVVRQYIRYDTDKVMCTYGRKVVQSLLGTWMGPGVDGHVYDCIHVCV